MFHQSPPGLSPHTRLQWRWGADAPEGFDGAQAVVMEESVYVGGRGAGYKIFQYSWRKGVWSTLPECPVKGFGLTQFMGRLTTVGGQDQAGSRTARVYEFARESQRWQESLPPMPTASCMSLLLPILAALPSHQPLLCVGGEVMVGYSSILWRCIATPPPCGMRLSHCPLHCGG